MLKLTLILLSHAHIDIRQ